MTTFRALVCDLPGPDARRAAYGVVHDALCREVVRELGRRLQAWPPASAAGLAGADPLEQAARLRALLDDIPAAWRSARAQLCALAGNHPAACRHAGHLAWVLIAALFDALSAPVLQTALREVPDARLATLYANGTSHLPLFQYVARYELQRRLTSAHGASQSLTREIQEQAALGRMPDAAMLKGLAAGLRRRAALSQALDGGSAGALAASAAAVISTAPDGAGLATELQVLLDVLLVLLGGGHPAGEGDDASIPSIVTLADARAAAHASACFRAAQAVRRFVDFARSWNAPVFFSGSGQPLRLTRLLAVRAASVDDGSGRPAPQIQLTSSIGVRGDHPAITLVIVAQAGADGRVAGLADYAQLRHARPDFHSGKFTAAV